MAKVRTQFICTNCQTTYPAWQGKCSVCEEWNTIVESEVSALSGVSPPRKLSPKPLGSVGRSSVSRLKTGSHEVDLVLGGGLVSGSVVLIGGDPGIGKSTLSLLIAGHMATKHSVLYVCGEESVEQVTLRAERILQKKAQKLLLVSETELESLLEHLSETNYDVVIVDSIQSIRSTVVTSSAGSVAQVSYCATLLQRLAKASNTSVILIGHVTKEGSLAGPKVLEHLVDTVVYLEGERWGQFRLFRSLKNRFGRSGEVGVFEMQESGLIEVKDPSKVFVAEAAQSPGAVASITLEGTRAMAVEIQALASLTNFGYPRRTVSGVDLNRLQLLTAVLTKRLGVALNTQDIYCNIVGGVKVQDPGIDLGVAIALLSAFRNKDIRSKMVFIGEVGLGGEVRSVQGITRRALEAEKLGFGTIVVPRQSLSDLKKSPKFAAVRSVKEAADLAFAA